jgi:anti-anti-sigma factor
VANEDGIERAELSRGGRSGTAHPATTDGSGGEPQAVVVRLHETTLPSGLVELRSAVVVVVRSGARLLVVDVSGLDQLSSPTVTALLWARRRCRVQGSAVVLRGAGRRLLRLLRRTGLADVFDLEAPGAPVGAGTGSARRAS